MDATVICPVHEDAGTSPFSSSPSRCCCPHSVESAASCSVPRPPTPLPSPAAGNPCCRRPVSGRASSRRSSSVRAHPRPRPPRGVRHRSAVRLGRGQRTRLRPNGQPRCVPEDRRRSLVARIQRRADRVDVGAELLASGRARGGESTRSSGPQSSGGGLATIGSSGPPDGQYCREETELRRGRTWRLGGSRHVGWRGVHLPDHTVLARAAGALLSGAGLVRRRRGPGSGNVPSSVAGGVSWCRRAILVNAASPWPGRNQTGLRQG